MLIARRCRAKLKADPIRWAAHLERCRIRDRERSGRRRAALLSDPVKLAAHQKSERERIARARAAKRPPGYVPKKTAPRVYGRTAAERKAIRDAYNHRPDVAAKRKAYHARVRNDPVKLDDLRAKGRNYFLANKSKVYAYRAMKRKTDPNYRIACNLRTYIYQRIGMKNRTGQSRFKEIVGCTIEYLVRCLEMQFEPGMTWENYGKGDGKWSIDHRMPCATFDLTDNDQAKLCFHYTNLQPMWWRENLIKRDKVLKQTALPL